MSKSSSVISLGILVLLLPFVSIFRSWKDVVTFVLGALIIWTGYKMRRADFSQNSPDSNAEPK